MIREISLPIIEPTIESEFCTEIIKDILIIFNRRSVYASESFARESLEDIIYNQKNNPKYLVYPKFFQSGTELLYFECYLTDEEFAAMTLGGICD